MGAGLAVLAACCLLLPSMLHSLHCLLWTTAAVGVGYSVAFGAAAQLAAHFPPSATVGLSTGTSQWQRSSASHYFYLSSSYTIGIAPLRFHVL